MAATADSVGDYLARNLWREWWVLTIRREYPGAPFCRRGSVRHSLVLRLVVLSRGRGAMIPS